MIKNILVPQDGSPYSKAALDYSMWLAQKFGEIATEYDELAKLHAEEARSTR